MPLPFFLGALFGKAAAGALSKAIGSKAVVASGKAGHLFGKAAEKAVDAGVDHALSHKEKKKQKCP
jgi:hypothetical protein